MHHARFVKNQSIGAMLGKNGAIQTRNMEEGISARSADMKETCLMSSTVNVLLANVRGAVPNASTLTIMLYTPSMGTKIPQPRVIES
jgi:hypothetical protein